MKPNIIDSAEFIQWADDQWFEYTRCTAHVDGHVGTLKFLTNLSMEYKVVFNGVEIHKSHNFWLAKNTYNDLTIPT